MAQVDVVRPVSTLLSGAGVAFPSGTLHGVTSDNNDSTYIATDLSSSTFLLRMNTHTPPANHQRHRLRGRQRARTDAGTANVDIDVGRGPEPFINFSSVALGSVIAEQVTDWFQDPEFGLDSAGAVTNWNVGGGWVNSSAGGATALRYAEVYLDVDCRSRPIYAGEVRDGAGVDQSGGTVTDTAQPTIFFGAVDYDGLPALDWTLTVGGFSTGGSGAPPTSVQTSPLLDGSYTATLTVRSVIRGTDPFTHVQTISFDLENVVPPPSPPLLHVAAIAGGYQVSWENPGGQPWDDDYVVAELWRADCTGERRIATIPDGLSGSYTDYAVPQLDVGPDCAPGSDTCGLAYSVRYWGYVSTTIELPDNLPAGLILGWPGSVGSIPSGWSRVTALDARLPRGATGTGAPSATGGSTTHDHSTPGHTHTIAAHTHTLSFTSGSSNDSVTSARFNGASQTQADQPHTHNVAGTSNSAAATTSGSAAPDSSVASHLPSVRDVIWISSDGARTAYPIGALAWSAEPVAGWIDDPDSSGRFLRGAAAAGAGGGVAGGDEHDHTIAAHTHTGSTHGHTMPIGTSLSNPLSGTEAGTGSSTPRFVARHTHPISIASAATGSLTSDDGGTTSEADNDPLNRRLNVMLNTGGGIQTRIIGLYMGTIAALDPLLTHCDGSDGTPDMRGWFCRDSGSDGVNTTGGSSTHSHSTVAHSHGMPGHTHGVSLAATTYPQLTRATLGDLGPSPSTGHTHSGGSTASTSPSDGASAAGTTETVDHTPPYAEAHFVRLDGTISGGPLPIPELKVTAWSSATVTAPTYADGLDRLATADTVLPVSPDRQHGYPRLVIDSVGIDGGLHTVATTEPGEDLTLTLVVDGLPALDALESLLSETAVWWAPLGGVAGWFAPGSWGTRAAVPGVWVISVTMARIDWPATDDPEAYL